MHLLRVETGSLEDTAAAVDLEQSAAPLIFLSFTDSDLAALGRAWQNDSEQAERWPALRLAKLADLKHPYSIDLWIEKSAAQARTIVVRLLGGMDYWRYGVEQLSAMARNNSIRLAFVPGDYQRDARLSAASTVPADELEALWACFQHGGPENMRAALAYMAQGVLPVAREVAALKEVAFAAGEQDRAGLNGSQAHLPAASLPAPKLPAQPLRAPRGLIVFYRSAYLADDFAPMRALALQLGARGMMVRCVAVSSLKDPAVAAPLRALMQQFSPDVIFNVTAFSARLGEAGSLLDEADAPVLQVILSGSTRAAWERSTKALSAADQAMNIVLPEVDGRLVTRAISFKSAAPRHPDLEHEMLSHEADASGIAAVADLGLNWARLRQKRNADKVLALILSDYPAKGGRTGYAVGLDTPRSVERIAQILRSQGYKIGDVPPPQALMKALTEAEPQALMDLAAYRARFAALPDAFRQAVMETWGAPEQDPALHDGHFTARLLRLGALSVAVQPDRGRRAERKSSYHDANLPPCHGYIAFYLALRHCDALVHLGTHGTLEWLPGKAVCLSDACAPQVLLGAMPVIYPFIVNNPGEASQAKHRLSALTLGHMTPPLRLAGTHGALAEVEALMDEYAQAQTLDQRRAAHLANAILNKAQSAGLMSESGAHLAADRDDALARLDNWLCDIKEMRIGDGLHVFGEGPCGAAEADGLLKALAGRFVPPGPAGAPVQGRQDVLPTGRNLYCIDPRAIPSRTAWEIGQRLAQDVLETYAQEHGEWPKKLVLDLWASSAMRTGGDDLAQAFAFLGLKPVWDDSSTRVSGFEIVPLAKLGRARVDVTLRISGLFRDCFSTQIALFDAAVRAVAALDESSEDNPLVAKQGARVFGSAPGSYGLGLGDMLSSGQWTDRAELGQSYLDANSHAYDGGEGQASEDFRAHVASADAFVHVQDMAGQDVLDSDAYAFNEGGFAAAAALLGRKPTIYHADTTGRRPKIRKFQDEVARVLRARATNPAWLEGQMRHGHRGAGEIAETVENVFNVAALSGMVDDAQFDALFDATLGDERLRQFLIEANEAAARAIMQKFREALQRGLWHCRRNWVLAVLAEEVGHDSH